MSRRNAYCQSYALAARQVVGQVIGSRKEFRTRIYCTLSKTMTGIHRAWESRGLYYDACEVRYVAEQRMKGELGNER